MPSREGQADSCAVQKIYGEWHQFMLEILKTNDPVALSFVAAVLKDAGVESVVFDQNASILDGSIGAIPRRLMIDSDDFEQARLALKDPEILQYLSKEMAAKVAG